MSQMGVEEGGGDGVWDLLGRLSSHISSPQLLVGWLRDSQASAVVVQWVDIPL